MNKKLIVGFVLFNLAMVINFASLFAHEKKPASRFSHKGLKGAISFGSFENEFGAKYKDGEAGALSLGYGFDDNFTLWLSGFGVEHPQNTVNLSKTEFAGLEVNLQYKFISQSRLQPYGKIGVGYYGIGVHGTNVVYMGTGFALAGGADFFLTKHFGVGIELLFKNIDYSKESRKINGKDVVSDINPKLDGKSAGLMLTITLQ